MKYIIADTHFGHANIIRLCNRPFISVEEMDEVMINNWNNIVTDDDDVYIVGDFSYRSADPCKYANALKGKKHLIIGNHDLKTLKNPEFRKCFVEIDKLKAIPYKDTRIVLCHYPLVEWDGMYRGTLHFFGHIHNNENYAQIIMRNIENAYNVGVDVIGFAPKTIEEILSK